MTDCVRSVHPDSGDLRTATARAAHRTASPIQTRVIQPNVSPFR